MKILTKAFLILACVACTQPRKVNKGNHRNLSLKGYCLLKRDSHYARGRIQGAAKGRMQGAAQPPVSLKRIGNMKPLEFLNYKAQFYLPSKLENTGTSINMPLKYTVQNESELPILSGAHLGGNYIPEELAFLSGSEHTINDRHFDIEMHIIHRKIDYVNGGIASNNTDEYVAIAMMMDIVDNPFVKKKTPLELLFTKLGSMQRAGEEVEGNRTFGLEGIMKGINRNEFYSYIGPLTKSGCDQSVWIVFNSVLLVQSRAVSDLLELIKRELKLTTTTTKATKPPKRRRRLGPSEDNIEHKRKLRNTGLKQLYTRNLNDSDAFFKFS